MRLKTVKQSLLLVKRLAGTTGTTGMLLRREISYILFTMSNIREVLHDGRIQSELYQLAIETLASIAMDKEAREKIGGTGGVVKELVALIMPAVTKVRGNRQTDAIRVQAGEARYVTLFVEHGMEADLRRIASNTSELECFNVFLGNVGLGRGAISAASLVTLAPELMKLQR